MSGGINFFTHRLHDPIMSLWDADFSTPNANNASDDTHITRAAVYSAQLNAETGRLIALAIFHSTTEPTTLPCATIGQWFKYDEWTVRAQVSHNGRGVGHIVLRPQHSSHAFCYLALEGTVDVATFNYTTVNVVQVHLSLCYHGAVDGSTAPRIQESPPLLMQRVDVPKLALHNLTVCVAPLFRGGWTPSMHTTARWLAALQRQGVDMIHVFHMEDQRSSFPNKMSMLGRTLRIVHHVQTPEVLPRHQYAGPYFEQSLMYAFCWLRFGPFTKWITHIDTDEVPGLMHFNGSRTQTMAAFLLGQPRNVGVVNMPGVTQLRCSTRRRGLAALQPRNASHAHPPAKLRCRKRLGFVYQKDSSHYSLQHALVMC